MRAHKRSKKPFLLLATLVILISMIGWAFLPDQSAPFANNSSNPSPTPPASHTPQPTTPVINLQPTVDAWADKQRGTASVVIYDLANKKTVASFNPDRQYFTASIYKLYVAYIGYQEIADGTYDGDSPYLGSYSRLDCLDKMIRDSYSPCGEKMWNELGKAALTAKLIDYGLTNTSMTGLYTSANDAAIILQRLYERKELTQVHTSAFLDSMKDQPATYRRGLPSGFSKSVVYNKVGLNLQLEWHDTAIITLPNGRAYVVSVLTKNVGSSNVADLGRAIEQRLTR